MLAKKYLFESDHFPPLPAQEADERLSAAGRDRVRRISAAMWESNKYYWILELLRNAQSRSAKMRIIAWWLNEEQICPPEDIIPEEELRGYANTLFRGLSASDFRHAGMVKAWIPYFTKLLQDLGRTGSKSKLLDQGYDDSALTVSLQRREPVSAACVWLAKRPGTPGHRALENAYSRIYGRKTRGFIKRFPALRT